MKIRRQARNNIVKRPDIFGNSNAVFACFYRSWPSFLQCKKGTKGKETARQRAGDAFETPAKPQKDYLSDDTRLVASYYSAGMMVARNTSLIQLVAMVLP
jgi:hypothetical protein